MPKLHRFSLFIVLVLSTMFARQLWTCLSSKHNTTAAVERPTKHQNNGDTLPATSWKGLSNHSWLGSALGRQYAHHKVILTLEAAFEELHELTGQTLTSPIAIMMADVLAYQTHQYGLRSIRPMMIASKPARLTTDPLSMYGYCWHIDDKTHHLNGRKWDVQPGNKYPQIMNWLCPTIPWKSDKEVDFRTLKLMIDVLKKHARRQGGRVKYVIVDPSFKAKLQVGVPLRTAKIDHDDHIHVEFAF